MVLHRSGSRTIRPGAAAKALVGACIVSLCTSSALAHDWYTGLIDPVTGSSCCGGQDCHPVPRENIRVAENGGIELFLGWGGRPLDPQRSLKNSSPDSRGPSCSFFFFLEFLRAHF